MANIANFVSILIAKNVVKNFVVFTILLSLLLNCAGAEQNSRDIELEFQNGEDDVEIFVDNLDINNQKNEYGQLKNRVVVVNGKTVVGGEEKEGNEGGCSMDIDSMFF